MARLILIVLTCLPLLGCGTTNKPDRLDAYYEPIMSDEYAVIYLQFLQDLDTMHVDRKYVHIRQLVSIMDGEPSSPNRMGETVYLEVNDVVYSTRIVINPDYRPDLKGEAFKYLVYHELVHALLYQRGHVARGMMYPYGKRYVLKDQTFADLQEYITIYWSPK